MYEVKGFRRRAHQDGSFSHDVDRFRRKENDRTYAWEQTALLWQAIEKAHLAVVPGCAHAVHLEKPELFAALLRDYLQPPEPKAII